MRLLSIACGFTHVDGRNNGGVLAHARCGSNNRPRIAWRRTITWVHSCFTGRCWLWHGLAICSQGYCWRLAAKACGVRVVQTKLGEDYNLQHEERLCGSACTSATTNTGAHLCTRLTSLHGMGRVRIKVGLKRIHWGGRGCNAGGEVIGGLVTQTWWLESQHGCTTPTYQWAHAAPLLLCRFGLPALVILLLLPPVPILQQRQLRRYSCLQLVVCLLLQGVWPEGAVCLSACLWSYIATIKLVA